MADAPLLTVKEVADILRTTEQAVYMMSKRGKLPGIVKIGRRVLVKREELLASLGL